MRIQIRQISKIEEIWNCKLKNIIDISRASTSIKQWSHSERPDDYKNRSEFPN